jgi:hypothetical protein
MSNTLTALPPLPFGERASRRDLARASLRKSRGGKGEGAGAPETCMCPIPLTRSEAKSFAATSPRWGEVWA